MIAKHVPMRSLGKSDFAALAEYVTDAQSKDHRLGQVHPPKDDARVGLRRAQGQLHALATVQSHANGAGQGLEGALLEHPHILVACPATCWRAPTRTRFP